MAATGQLQCRDELGWRIHPKWQVNEGSAQESGQILLQCEAPEWKGPAAAVRIHPMWGASSRVQRGRCILQQHEVLL